MKILKLLEGIKTTRGKRGREYRNKRNMYRFAQGCQRDAFIAVAGFVTDGHNISPKLLENGASLIICEKKPNEDCRYVTVDVPAKRWQK
jgi:UDP-N-acetylmuramoyl-L-alanyl-D-glutamate--2,6-diaminopimelate ligase